MIYRLFFRLVLARVDAERMHRLASGTLRAVNRVPPFRALLRALLFPRDERLRVSALGLEFPSPLGLAAGFDKDATTFDAYATLGFGCVEVGTVTAQAQSGLPGKRIYRISREHAVVNWMGFPNEGADAVAERLRRRRAEEAVIGVNVGKSKVADLEDAGADFEASVRRLAPYADYLVLNVSSPNTPGLRDLQAADRLRELIATVRQGLEGLRHTPLLVKISPDLSDREIDSIADLAMELGLDGIVAVNTTVNMDRLTHAPEEYGVPRRGGISGAPLRPRAREIIRRLHVRTGGQLILVSVGGIDSAEEAWERIRAGATLLQAHTGFVYGGPFWPHRINRELARLVTESGLKNVQEAVGIGTQQHSRSIGSAASENGMKAKVAQERPAPSSTVTPVS